MIRRPPRSTSLYSSAASAQRIVQLAAAVGGQNHNGAALCDERTDFGDGDRGLPQELEQQGLKLVVRAVDLVDQQHRRHWSHRPDCLEDRPLLKELRSEQIGIVQGRLPGLRESDRQQLTLVVPLVERLAGSCLLYTSDAA